MLEEDLGVSPSPELAMLEARIAARDVPGVDEGRRCYPRPRHPLRLPYSLGRAHFVGRNGDYALLAERLREAMGSSGGAVAVEGEAGIGKTRLVEEFLGYAKSRGALVLAGRCYERELGPALEPISDALGSLPDTGCRWGQRRLLKDNLCAYECHARSRRESSPNTPCSSALRHSSTVPSTEKAMGIS